MPDGALRHDSTTKVADEDIHDIRWLTARVETLQEEVARLQAALQLQSLGEMRQPNDLSIELPAGMSMGYAWQLYCCGDAKGRGPYMKYASFSPALLGSIFRVTLRATMAAVCELNLWRDAPSPTEAARMLANQLLPARVIGHDAAAGLKRLFSHTGLMTIRNQYVIMRRNLQATQQVAEHAMAGAPSQGCHTGKMLVPAAPNGASAAKDGSLATRSSVRDSSKRKRPQKPAATDGDDDDATRKRRKTDVPFTPPSCAEPDYARGAPSLARVISRAANSSEPAPAVAATASASTAAQRACHGGVSGVAAGTPSQRRHTGKMLVPAAPNGASAAKGGRIERPQKTAATDGAIGRAEKSRKPAPAVAATASASMAVKLACHGGVSGVAAAAAMDVEVSLAAAPVSTAAKRHAEASGPEPKRRLADSRATNHCALPKLPPVSTFKKEWCDGIRSELRDVHARELRVVAPDGNCLFYTLQLFSGIPWDVLRWVAAQSLACCSAARCFVDSDEEVGQIVMSILSAFGKCESKAIDSLLTPASYQEAAVARLLCRLLRLPLAVVMCDTSSKSATAIKGWPLQQLWSTDVAGATVEMSQTSFNVAVRLVLFFNQHYSPCILTEMVEEKLAPPCRDLAAVVDALCADMQQLLDPQARTEMAPGIQVCTFLIVFLLSCCHATASSSECMTQIRVQWQDVANLLSGRTFSSNLSDALWDMLYANTVFPRDTG